MKKFSYALEFYKEGLFDLNNTKLFKLKVKEAEEIEKYFNQVIPNIELVRKYVFRSYIFNKKIRGLRRIAYIKGLIYAENYVDINDLFEFNEYISENLTTEPKESLWKYKRYSENIKSEDEFEGTIEDNNTSSELIIKVDYENISFDEEDEDEYESEYAEAEQLDKILTKMDELEEFENLDDEFMPIHPKEKLKEFKSLKEKYIAKTIEEKKISDEEKSMVKKGMNDWINYILNSMQDVYDLNEKVLRFNDENISKYL